MAVEAAKEYKSSLDELTFNSKLHINVLTMLADENVKYAESIVGVIEEHINKVSSWNIKNELFSIMSMYTVYFLMCSLHAAFDLKEKMFQDTGLTALKSYWSVRKVAGPTNCRVLYNVLWFV